MQIRCARLCRKREINKEQKDKEEGSNIGCARRIHHGDLSIYRNEANEAIA